MYVLILFFKCKYFPSIPTGNMLIHGTARGICLHGIITDEDYKFGFYIDYIFIIFVLML